MAGALLVCDIILSHLSTSHLQETSGTDPLLETFVEGEEVRGMESEDWIERDGERERQRERE
jgi:hypothetical protein